MKSGTAHTPVAEPSQSRRQPLTSPGRSAVARQCWWGAWPPAGSTFPSSHSRLPPALLNPFPVRCLVLYPSRAPSSLTIATSKKGWAGIFEQFGNVIPKAPAWEKHVSPRWKTSQAVLFAGLFGLAGVVCFSPWGPPARPSLPQAVS